MLSMPNNTFRNQLENTAAFASQVFVLKRLPVVQQSKSAASQIARKKHVSFPVVARMQQAGMKPKISYSTDDCFGERIRVSGTTKIGRCTVTLSNRCSNGLVQTFSLLLHAQVGQHLHRSQ
jgi:hypothetical protein